MHVVVVVLPSSVVVSSSLYFTQRERVTRLLYPPRRRERERERDQRAESSRETRDSKFYERVKPPFVCWLISVRIVLLLLPSTPSNQPN
jgi:hypothetical protein